MNNSWFTAVTSLLVALAIVLALAASCLMDVDAEEPRPTPVSGNIGPRAWLPFVASEEARPTPTPPRATVEVGQ